jgi:hypothetical protein
MPTRAEDDAFWDVERSLWLGGPEAYAGRLDPACLMAFPGVGVLDGGPAIADSLRQAPRWDSVDIDHCHVARPTDGLAVLAYRAVGRRADAEPYGAWCTSTWRRDDGAWRLTQHQQTPT